MQKSQVQAIQARKSRWQLQCLSDKDDATLLEREDLCDAILSHALYQVKPFQRYLSILLQDSPSFFYEMWIFIGLHGLAPTQQTQQGADDPPNSLTAIKHKRNLSVIAHACSVQL